ncbi:MAG: cytochrome c3 family protein [Deltaproteobacteria bacterium]|nr:cytochrome c3 family protein [Deltaproteobacteria bacterium]
MKRKSCSNLIRRTLGGIGALLALFLVLAHAAGWSGQTEGVPRREGVEPGNCAGCHGTGQVLPADHGDIRGMGSAECAECHTEGATSLRTRIPLGHIHQLNGVSCRDCHGDLKTLGPVATQGCLACHESAEKMAEATAKLDPNPHTSPHYGTTLDCDLCHKQHRKSENFCSQCHEWKLRVP